MRRDGASRVNGVEGHGSHGSHQHPRRAPRPSGSPMLIEAVTLHPGRGVAGWSRGRAADGGAANRGCDSPMPALQLRRSRRPKKARP